MNNWRSFAKAGRWDLVDWTQVPEVELPELLGLVQIVVPTVQRGDGIEYRTEHATGNDRDKLREWVDSGADVLAMEKVQACLAGITPAETSMADVVRRSNETYEECTGRKVRLVSQAAALLDELAAFLDEKPSWEAEAEELAIEKLADAGISYAGLRTTWVVEEPPLSKSLVQAAAETGQTLESLAGDDRFAFTAVWHAANILRLCREYSGLGPVEIQDSQGGLVLIQAPKREQ